jgi:hypothetical protein
MRFFGLAFWALLYFSPVLSGQSSKADPPAQPEVTISNTTRAVVLSQLMDQLTPQKYRVASSSEGMVVFEKDGGILESLLAGSRYDAHVVTRASFSIVVLGPDVRLLGTAAMIGNPNSAFERQTPLDTKRHRRDMQSLLESVRSWSENKAPKPQAMLTESAAAPPPLSVAVSAPVPTERQLLERDLVDVRRLKGLAAPGSKDFEYYAHREVEIESRIAGLDLQRAAPVSAPALEEQAVPETQINVRLGSPGQNPQPEEAPATRLLRSNAELLADPQFKLAMGDCQRLGVIEGYAESGQNTLTVELGDKGNDLDAIDHNLSSLFAGYRSATGYDAHAIMVLRHAGQIVGKYTTSGLVKMGA